MNVTLLSLALADRINIMKKEVTDAQAQALDLQKEVAATLEAEVQRRTKQLQAKNEQLQLLDRQKTTFFQNVSHELRTPLTLILNPLEDVLGEPRHAQDRRLEMAVHNSRRLLRVVNQLLDFQKLAAGKQKLARVALDARPLVQTLAHQFKAACEPKQIPAAGIGHRRRGSGGHRARRHRGGRKDRVQLPVERPQAHAEAGAYHP